MPNDPFELLVVALLSVNNYSVERTLSLRNALRGEELFSPTSLASLRSSQIAERLGKAGYDRGPFLTSLIAHRLACLGEHIVAIGPKANAILASGSREQVETLLLVVDGIGPAVLHTFLALRKAYAIP
jgi:hypothetical protein